MFNTNSTQFLPENKKGGNILNFFMNFVLLDIKPDKDSTKKKTTDQYIINIDDKFLNKILMNKI